MVQLLVVNFQMLAPARIIRILSGNSSLSLCRWFIFPCCNCPYACEKCHNEKNNHEPQVIVFQKSSLLINVYAVTVRIFNRQSKFLVKYRIKTCNNCGKLLSGASTTKYWEGGYGCRDKTYMNRNDRKKYANTNKTVSKKKISKSKE